MTYSTTGTVLYILTVPYHYLVGSATCTVALVLALALPVPLPVPLPVHTIYSPVSVQYCNIGSASGYGSASMFENRREEATGNSNFEFMYSVLAFCVVYNLTPSDYNILL